MTPQMFLKKLWRLNRTLPVVFGVMLLLNLLVFATDHWYVAPRLDALQKTYFEQRDMLREGGNGAGKGLAGKMQQDKEELSVFHSVVGDRSDFTDFIAELFSLADRSGLSIDSVKYQPDEIAEHGLLQYSLSFSVEGSYNNIKKFIFLLEQSKRILIIEEMALTGSSEANSGQTRLKLRLSTYFGTGKA